MSSSPRRAPRGANIFVPFRKKSQRTGWAGRLYGAVEWIGPVTRSSPIRRAIQIVCLLLPLVPKTNKHNVIIISGMMYILRETEYSNTTND